MRRAGIGLLVAALGAATAWGAIINVPGDYTTIQAAINAAAVGDTIQVAAGTYQESLGGYRDIQIFKSVEVIGAGSGQTVVELTGLQHGVEIRPDPTGTVLLQGITFTKPAANAKSADWAIIVGETGGTFANVTLRDVEVAWAAARNLHFANATYNQIVIEDCDIHDAGAWGCSVRGTIQALDITNSDFTNCGWSDPAHGIGFDIDLPINIQSVAVTGGSFSYNTAKGINLVKTNNAVFDGVTASHNGGAADNGFGVSLWEWMSASSDITFRNSTFAGNALDGVMFGTEGTTTIANVTIEQCSITGNNRSGVLFYHALGGTVSNVRVTGCDISGNSGQGIATSNIGSEVIAAEFNYWGDASGPYDATGTNEAGNPPCYDPADMMNTDGLGNGVGDNVDYCPWLVDAPTTVRLVPDATCYKVGESVVVDVVLSADREIVGGQFWLEYDADALTYVGSTAVLPWSVKIHEIHTSPVIFLAVGVPDEQSGAPSGIMATLEFTVVDEICSADELVTFKDPDGSPPTRLGDAFDNAVYPQKENLAAITIDGTPPYLVVPADVTVECDESTEPAFTGFPEFLQGFETNRDGWLDYNGTLVRVPSGTDGVVSAAGDWHAVVDGAFTRWGGYQSTFPAGGYTTAADIYLNVDVVLPNDKRFDYSSAINGPTGTHRRDFVFNGGFYTDLAGGSTSGYVFSASPNAGRANAYPKNPGRDPIEITTTGWYTFTHRFYDAGGGVLAVDLTIKDSGGNTVGSWTLSDPTDIIGTTVGGNRYGWFLNMEMPLPIDNTRIDRGAAVVVDNCDPAPVLSYEDVIEPGSCPQAYTIRRTWSAVDACENVAEAVQLITVEDTTAPFITCPDDITVNADAGTCEAVVPILPAGWVLDMNASVVETGDPANPYVVQLRSVEGDPEGPWGPTAALVWMPTTPLTFADITQLSADFSMEQGCVTGGTPRFSIGIDSDGDGVVNGNVFAHWGPEGSPWSDCPGPGPGWRSTGDLVASADPRWEGAQLGGDTVMTYAEVAALVNALPFSNVVRVIVPLDGFWSHDQIMLVENVRVDAATFNLGDAMATDNCDPAPAITWERSDGKTSLSDPYAAVDSPITITWTATDACGNVATCDQTVTVNEFNELVVNLELNGVTTGTFERCVEFLLQPGDVAVSQVVEFTNGRADGVVVEVPCADAAYTCIQARDPLHSLWSADDESFGIVGTQYVADFTNDSGDPAGSGYDNRLVLGNLNGDEWVDVIDFAIYVVRVFQQFEVNVDCNYTDRHPDFDGTGLVDTGDYTVINANFLLTDDLCTTKLRGSSPVTRIAVRDLVRLRLTELAPADLNHDGWIDEHDMAAFASGVLPEFEAEVTVPIEEASGTGTQIDVAPAATPRRPVGIRR